MKKPFERLQPNLTIAAGVKNLGNAQLGDALLKTPKDAEEYYTKVNRDITLSEPEKIRRKAGINAVLYGDSLDRLRDEYNTTDSIMESFEAKIAEFKDFHGDPIEYLKSSQAGALLGNMSFMDAITAAKSDPVIARALTLPATKMILKIDDKKQKLVDDVIEMHALGDDYSAYHDLIKYRNLLNDGINYYSKKLKEAKQVVDSIENTMTKPPAEYVKDQGWGQ